MMDGNDTFDTSLKLFVGFYGKAKQTAEPRLDSIGYFYYKLDCRCSDTNMISVTPQPDMFASSSSEKIEKLKPFQHSYLNVLGKNDGCGAIEYTLH
jgi:hypothetical protein